MMARTGVLAPLLQMAALLALLVLAGLSHRLDRRRLQVGGALIAIAFACSFGLSTSFVFQKWLGRLLMPPALAWVALLLAALWALRSQKRRAATLLLAGLCAYWLVTNMSVAKLCLRSLEAPYVGARHAPTEPFEAVLVLGGSHSVRPSGDSQLSLSGDRIASAARRYNRGETRRIVLTGADVPASGADRVAVMLQELGVPSDAIVKVPGPVNTSQEIEALAALCRDEGWTHVGLITSAWHMRRAMRLADRQGFAPQPLPADFWSQSAPPTILNVLPSGQAMFEVRVAAWEWLGSLVGR